MPCAAPPILFNRWSYAGWLTALVQALPTKAVVGIFYIVGASLWTLEAVLSVWVLQLVRNLPSRCRFPVLSICPRIQRNGASWACPGSLEGCMDCLDSLLDF